MTMQLAQRAKRPVMGERNVQDHDHLAADEQCMKNQQRVEILIDCLDETATNMLAVLSYTTATCGYVTSVLACVAESGRHGCRLMWLMVDRLIV